MSQLIVNSKLASRGFGSPATKQLNIRSCKLGTLKQSTNTETRMLQTKDVSNRSVNNQPLLAYVADLELEVDRLRKTGQFLRHEARAALQRVLAICGANVESNGSPKAPTPAQLTDISQVALELEAILRDLHDPPGYHPAHDQVIAVAVRPLVEQVFRNSGC